MLQHPRNPKYSMGIVEWRCWVPARSWPTAIMPFSGVRISWLMRARNWLFTSVAAAAYIQQHRNEVKGLPDAVWFSSDTVAN